MHEKKEKEKEERRGGGQFIIAMGAATSCHFAHPQGKHHRFHHVGSNEVQGQCGMCSQATQLGVEVYRCGSYGFLLHADCYARPEKITDHFAHPGHPLTLSDGHPIAAGRQCNVCAVAFDAGAPSCFVYGCGQCHGFYAHPRCAALPRTMLNHALHPHTLTLLSPPRWHSASARRRCLNAAGGCRNAARLAGDARSYQCNPCTVELCLACQLPAAGADVARRRRRTGCAGVVVRETAHQVGTAIGTLIRSMGCACLGVPVNAPATTSGGLKS
jgi:hypothetical protein